MSTDELAAQVAQAKRRVADVKVLYHNHVATYDDMAAAAKVLSAVMYEYQAVKFPGRRPVRIPYQAILR